MSNYYEISYDKNMEMLSQAVKYCEENFLHEDIINELYNDNDLKKQLCLIELKNINNQQEADILVSNLTEHSGPIRETASFKILELIKKNEYRCFFQTEKITDTFIKAVTDINPSVSRNAVEIIKYTDNSQYIYGKIIEEINKILSETNNTAKQHSYKTNKKNFALYWNLEAVISLSSSITIGDELICILEQTAKSNDYTIREKSAKTAKVFNLTQIPKLFQNDENIYVRRYL